MARNKIKGVRTGLGLTQSDVAAQLGISVSSYQQKEQGRIPFTEKQKFKLARVLELNILETDELLFDGQFGIAQFADRLALASTLR